MTTNHDPATKVADYLRKRAVERAQEGAAIQLGYAVLVQDLSMGTDLGGPTQEMIGLAEQVIGESTEKLLTELMRGDRP